MNIILIACATAVAVYLLPILILVVAEIVVLLIEPFIAINNIWHNLWLLIVKQIDKKKENKDISNLEL